QVGQRIGQLGTMTKDTIRLTGKEQRRGQVLPRVQAGLLTATGARGGDYGWIGSCAPTVAGAVGGCSAWRATTESGTVPLIPPLSALRTPVPAKIGRASCRERGCSSVV